MPTLTQILSDSDTGEAVPILKLGNKLYISELYGGNPNSQGSISVLDLSTSTKTSLSGWIDGLAQWNGVYDKINNKLYIVGESKDSTGTFRSTVSIVDLSNDTYNRILHPNTGDANELIGVLLDYDNKRLIVGERQIGGNTTGSSYPNGGGLWVIPLDTITDTSTWNRVYEDPDYSEWRALVRYGNTIYAVQQGGNTAKNRVIYADISDLTTWTTLETYANNFVPSISTLGKMIAYLLRDDSNNVLLKWSNDASTWNSLTVTTSADVVSGRIQIFGKYILVLLDDTTNNQLLIYLVDTSSSTIVYSSTLTGVNGAFNKGITIGDDNAFYFGYGGGGVTPGIIEKLEFDTTYTLLLSISGTPTAGSTITITATLKDSSGNPISGVNIDFYVLHSIDQMIDSNNEEYIGSSTTDTNGNASITYTLPSTIKTLWFRAIYNG